ncbi:MAG: DUF1887 family protein [Clostridia bacterium]|nr:DUF1887 family protein [Clostridia bacterium]
MTYVEFFDKTSVRNICSCLADDPDRVIFIGDNKKLMKKYIDIYRELFLQRGKDIDFSYRCVIKNDLDSVIDLLSEIVEKNEEIIFDLDGGEDVYLMAVGMIYERYFDRKIKLQRVNVQNNTLCLGTDEEKHITGLSVPEHIRIYDGNVIFDDVIREGTHIWDYTDDFKNDIDKMWDICRRDNALWNREIKDLQVLEKNRMPSKDILYTMIQKSSLERPVDIRIMNSLIKAGLILDYKQTDSYISYRYKNEQVKRCLVKAGQVLEMKIYSVAKSVLDSKGKAVYDDVMNGVCIDWDGEDLENGEGIVVENEIDVMMTKGVVPVFISCKNGQVDVNELYKLNTVAQRFGGDYAKKVLVVTSLERNGGDSAEFFRDRARSMGIRLLENVQHMRENELERTVKNLWRT